MTATEIRTRRPAVTEPPSSVRTATTILYILVGLGLVSPIAFLAVTAASMARGNPFNPELTLAVALAAASVVVGWFCLTLIKKTRKGRRWAWLTLIMVLALIGFVGALVMTSISDGAAIGMVMTAVPLILIGMLAGPRHARAYYRRAHFYQRGD